MIEELREELYLYNLLRQLFLKEPTMELINELSRIDLTDEADDDISYGLKLLIESIKKTNPDFMNGLRILPLNMPVYL